MKSETVIAFLLGAVVALSCMVAVMFVAKEPQPVYATEAGRGDVFGMLGTGYQGQSRDTVFIIDAAARRLAVYDYKNERIKLTTVRNIKWDLKFEEFPGRPPQKPSVKEMRKLILDQEKKEKN